MKIILSAFLMMAMVGCNSSGGTSTGNPLVAVNMKSYNSTMAMTSLKFCFKRIRFKMSGQSTNPDPTTDSDNLDFYLGEVNISNLGTTLESVSLPAGTYTRIEMDLDNSCPSGKSVQLTNSNGSFNTNQGITIRFDGTFTHSGANDAVNLGVQQIISALNTVTSDSDIRSKAEGVSGSF